MLSHNVVIIVIMKNVVLLLTAETFLLFGCTQKAPNSHPAAHTVELKFTVSDGANILSYNVYQNDKLINQMPASVTPDFEYIISDIKEIDSHPYDVSFTVEPMFSDSSNANTNIAMEIKVDDKLVANAAKSNVLYKEVVNLAYSGE